MKNQSLPAELRELLVAYLAGRRTIADCGEWVAGVDWDDQSLASIDRTLLGRLELLTTETAEGLRDESELKRYAKKLLANELTV